MDNDILICRCEEITRQQIIDAIRDGAHTVDGVKRRTRAGMGLCQGKTCERLIQSIIASETSRNPADIKPQNKRMPVRPITVGMFQEKD